VYIDTPDLVTVEVRDRIRIRVADTVDAEALHQSALA
jgi:hypothetical protein